MADTDQDKRYEREIGELHGKLESLATKEFVREVVQEQTRELNTKFDKISGDLRVLNEKQHRITGAADIIKTALPLLVSIATFMVLIISLLAAAG